MFEIITPNGEKVSHIGYSMPVYKWTRQEIFAKKKRFKNHVIICLDTGKETPIEKF